MIVVDASAVIEWLLLTAMGIRVESRLLARGETLHAPHLLDVEVAQVLRRLAALNKITPARAREALDDLADLAVARYPHTVLLSRMRELGENLTAYDAAYVALAEALDAPLVTCDDKIAQAPGHAAHVEVIRNR